ncbi:MAG TPA: thioredoxin-disulfide reductase [Gemmatimonadaceae bacterium]|nr:thioredoxin-disulfide reductase [Gemmatimonadaceae bacterium]HRQ78742.1 thioredoxin-disulfide reductase [Gemmatimonadaceae bacterium]
MATHEYEVVIIGAGPAGMCAGLYAGRSMLKSVVLERGFPGGELLNTEVIEDYIGFEHVLGHELATKFQNHAEKFGAQILTSTPVEAIKKASDGLFDVTVENGDVYRAPTVIVTAGGTPVKLNIPGEIEYAGKGVSYCAICDGAFYKGHTILVVGGGDAALEEADFLTRYAEKVYLVHRRDEFRASKIVQQRAFANPKIEVITDTVVDEVVGQGGLMTHAKIRNLKTGAASDLVATGIFIFIGFTPNTGMIKEHVTHDSAGYLITDANMQTSVPGLFAAGDVRAQLTRQVTTAVGDATTAAIAVEKFLTARKNGQPAPAPVPMLIPSA